MTFGEGSADLELIGALVREVARLADTPSGGMTHMGAVNARIWDAIGNEGVKACVPGDPAQCPIAAYLRVKLKGAMTHAYTDDLSVGRGAIQIGLPPLQEGWVSRRFVLDTPGILAEFIADYDKARRDRELPDNRPDVLTTLIDGVGK